MVKKLFWENPYQHILETRLHSVEENRVTVEETIFYAASGGQESDHGEIAGRRVLQAEKAGRQIFYTLASADGLQPGQGVLMSIDATRRFRLMRLHFAAEIILELIYQGHPATKKTGAHIGASKARIDLEWKGSIAGELPQLARDFTHIVDSDLPIECGFSDIANERRYWKIAGFAKVPCGGTHVRTTGEIGGIHLKRKNPGRDRERIELVLARP